MKKSLKISTLLLVGLSAIGLSSCGTPRDVLRDEVAMRVSMPAFMARRIVQTDQFELTAFERMHERNREANLYIEGDGKANESRAHHLFIATPVNPVGLHLATKDNAINLGYLARPCQYTEEFKKDENPSTFCGDHYWTGQEYSDVVVKGYNDALDIMKKKYGITRFNIIGYDGGATLGAILAAERNDVNSLRTVAGKLDMAALEPHLEKLRYMPQHHFIGGADEVVTPSTLHTYLQALGDTKCAEYTLIQEAQHEKGWVDKWPELLRTRMPICAPEAPFVPIERPKPVKAPVPGGNKK
jgi:hypothetical protein